MQHAPASSAAALLASVGMGLMKMLLWSVNFATSTVKCVSRTRCAPFTSTATSSSTLGRSVRFSSLMMAFFSSPTIVSGLAVTTASPGSPSFFTKNISCLRVAPAANMRTAAAKWTASCNSGIARDERQGPCSKE